MNDLDILKFIRKELSPEEESAFLEWMEESEENRKRFNGLKNLWALTAINSEAISARMADTDEEDDRYYRPGLRKGLISFCKYAAIIVVTFGLSLYVCRVNFASWSKKEVQYHTVSAPPGQATNITLADGTGVTLNSGTVLTYPENYSEKNRRVSLTGEAFFEVHHDSRNPFTVTASGIDIVATGTSFNVDAYTEDCQVNVTLVEGSVGLFNEEGENLVTLNPGENVRIAFPSREMEVTQVDTKFYTSWQQGMITFSNRRLEDIARDLERWYSVEIIFTNDACKDIRYSGAILKHKPVDQVLEILHLTSDFTFDIEVIDNKLSRITIKE
jgi:ferric-dicitrate binding protein FerR (iron transport regulator)